MSTERMMILEMLENGKITPADARILLQALGGEDPEEVDDAAGVAAPRPPEAVLQGEVNQPPESRPSAEPVEPVLPPDAPPAPAVRGRWRWPGVVLPRLLAPRPAPADNRRRRRYPDPSFAVAMKRSGLDFSIDQLFRMQEEDVDPEQAIRLASVRRPEWTTDDIVEMLVQGACPDLVGKLNELGLARLSAHDVIQLTEYDVDTGYLDRFKGALPAGLAAHELIEFFDHDVDPDLAIALKEIGSITTSEIIQASDQDVSPSFVRQVAQALPDITVSQLIALSDNDVCADFITGLAGGGFADLAIPQIIRLQENDVDWKDAVWFREKLGEQITVDALLRLADHDIGRDYVKPLLTYNLPDLTIDALIEMADHDVSAEDVALAREAYGDGITCMDLIDIADSR